LRRSIGMSNESLEELEVLKLFRPTCIARSQLPFAFVTGSDKL
jgi:hypothetical protein